MNTNETKHLDLEAAMADPAYAELLQQLESQINPIDYLPPSVREIAKLDMQQLESEFNLIFAKQSPRSRAQRDLIESRWQYEQTLKSQNENEE